MKKKLISLAMLVTVFAMQVVGVSAASKTATMAVVGNSKGYYEVDAMDQEELDTVAAADKTTADLIKDINAGTKTLEDLAKAESSIASEIEGKSLVTAFMDLRKIGDVSKTADGKDLDNKEITFELQDLSPIAIIAKVDASQAVTNTTGTSPKTGVDSTNTVPFAGAAVVLLGAAAVVAFRKKNA